MKIVYLFIFVRIYVVFFIRLISIKYTEKKKYYDNYDEIKIVLLLFLI